MFVPYRPSDYKGLLDEFYEAERKRKVRSAGFGAHSKGTKEIRTKSYTLLIGISMLVGPSLLFWFAQLASQGNTLHSQGMH